VSSECVDCGAIKNQRLYQEAFNLMSDGVRDTSCPPGKGCGVASSSDCAECFKQYYLKLARKNLGMEVAKDGNSSDRNSSSSG